MRVLALALAIAGVGACRKPTVAEDAAAAVTMEVTSAPAMPKLVSTGPSLPMPRDWPADVPIYPAAHLSKASTEGRKNDAGVARRKLEFETPDPFEKVLEFYHTKFEGAKKLIEMSVSIAHTMQYAQAAEIIDITIMSVMGLTQVSVSVSEAE